MFDSKLDILADGRVHKLRILRDAEPLRYADVLGLWQRDESFRSFFMSLLADAPFPAFRWETPPVTTDTVNRQFEFVILDSPWLALRPDSTPFADYFTADSDSGIVAFENLGRDATLVVPCPRGPDSVYGHLAAFTRQAPEEQNHGLWIIVGRTMQKRISDKPVWLSTAGGGVAWLHVRLDSYPKYYGFAPYREFVEPKAGPT